ncbi:hypothetical protein E4U42_004246 [Claviceps africana]|uniref:SnoaL-like domain-containing protein n=1 Tax=Claviceps africana TaxID=83212 RepID=A0A8K0NH51_9HYPO|nr:hypothetical protein E4U42_004246 [Claviceps africana]
MALPISLPGLTQTEAITDALYRVLAGFDRNDLTVFTSAIADGDHVTMELDDGTGMPAFKGRAAILTDVFGFVSSLDTTHMATNVRVLIRGDDKASLVCLVSGQHTPPGRAKEPTGPKYLVGAEYEMQLVRDAADGLWKIEKWVARVLWAQGDLDVMKPPAKSASAE